MKIYFTSLVAVLLSHLSIAQKIRYELSFPNAIHHEAQINLTVTQLPKKAAIFRMSRSSPGRYATHEFGKNVYNVKAVDENNRALALTRVDGDVYEVPQHNGTIRLTYTLFGNHPDGTYLCIDPESIHLNMPATFMWLKGYDQLPIEVKFNVPAGNAGNIATQLVPTKEAQTFTAPSLQYFLDSPVKIGKLITKQWQRTNANGQAATFQIALESAVPDSTASNFAQKIARIVDQAGAVFGEFPRYDYGSYTFLASLNPYIKGDGMEHRNSTVISIPIAFTGKEDVFEVFAHEFFHGWNVERIRPKTLEPFNFEKSNMSNELWFAEGFTQYYGKLLLVRAGLDSVDEFSKFLASSMNTKLLSPGATEYSPIDASNHAVFVDAAVSIDRTNYPNMFTSYYSYGAAIALALDLELREQFNKSLDELMQGTWQRFGKTEQPYTIDGLQAELARLTNPDYARSFFQKYIYGHEPIDYAKLLEKAGFVAKKAAPGKAWLGNVYYVEKENGVFLAMNTVKNTPIYEAGLDYEDQILALNDQSISKSADVKNMLEQFKPGQSVKVTYKHRGETKTAAIALKENPAHSVVKIEDSGAQLTPDMQRLRDGWLNGKPVK